VKIGQQGVHQPEAVARGDEQPGLASAGAKPAGGVRGALERAQHRGADRDDAATPGPRPRHKVSRHGRHLVPLGMHHMVLDSLCPDRQEGAGADVQRDEGMLDAALRQRRHQRRGEMQRRGRRRDRARPTCEQRLVVVAIARVAAARPLDVGGSGIPPWVSSRSIMLPSPHAN
jgi:hypothetical protein